MNRILLLLALFAGTASAATNLPGPVNRSSGGSQCTYVNVSGTETSAICANPTGPATFPLGLSQNVKTASTSYAMTSTDGYGIVAVTTGSSTITVTLPPPSASAGRSITIKKVDSGSGMITISPNASETIDGASTNVLNAQNSFVMLLCDGTNWQVLAVWDYLTVNGSSTTQSSPVANTGYPITGISISTPPGFWAVNLTTNIEFEPTGVNQVASAQIFTTGGTATTIGQLANLGTTSTSGGSPIFGFNITGPILVTATTTVKAEMISTETLSATPGTPTEIVAFNSSLTLVRTH